MGVKECMCIYCVTSNLDTEAKAAATTLPTATPTTAATALEITPLGTFV